MGAQTHGGPGEGPGLHGRPTQARGTGALTETSPGEGGVTFQDHYSEIADRYGRFRPSYPAELFDWLAGVVAAGARVLEVAAGSGQATRDLARVFPGTVATDASHAQLLRGDPGVDRIVAAAEALPFRDGTFDLVVAAQALHWFRFDRFFPEVERVVRPEGHFAAWTYRFPDFEGEMGSHFRALAYETLSAHWPAERRHVETGYATIPFPAGWARIPTPSLDIAVPMAVDDFVGYVRTWSAVVRAGDAGERAVEAFARTARAHWPEGERPTVRWPLTLVTFRVRPSPSR